MFARTTVRIEHVRPRRARLEIIPAILVAPWASKTIRHSLRCRVARVAPLGCCAQRPDRVQVLSARRLPTGETVLK